MNKYSASAGPTINWVFPNTGSRPAVRQAGTNPIRTRNVTVVRYPKDEGIDVDEFAALLEQSDEGKAAMAHGRRQVAKYLAEEEGGTLRTLRLRAGLSQAGLAEAIGLRQPNISSIEAGSRRPNIETAEKLAKVLGVSVEEVYAAYRQSGARQ